MKFFPPFAETNCVFQCLRLGFIPGMKEVVRSIPTTDWLKILQRIAVIAPSTLFLVLCVCKNHYLSPSTGQVGCLPKFHSLVDSNIPLPLISDFVCV